MFFGVPGMVSTYFGAWLAQYIAGIVQLVIFAFVMLLAAFTMQKKSNIEHVVHKRKNYKIIIDGILVGLVTGIVGVGGGFLIVPALVLMGGLGMRNAVATSLMIIAMNSYTGFYKYWFVLTEQNIQLNWHTIVVVSLIGIAGTFVGNYLCNKIPQATLKRYFAYFLMLMAIFILFKELPKVLLLL